MEDNSKDIKKVIIIAALIVVFVIGIAIGVIIAVLGTAKQTASVPENTAISTSSDEPAITVPTDADDVTSVVFETATGADSTSDNQPAVSTAVSVASPAGAPSGAAQTSNGISVSCKTGNSWENGGKTCTQIDAVISNNGSSTVSGWTLEMTVPSGANIEQSWNGTYTLNGTTLKIVSDNSNSEIKAGASSTTGFIIAASGKYNPSGVKINGSAVSTSQPSGNNTTQQQQQSNPAGNDTVKKTDAAANLKRADKAVQGDDWLSVKGNKIVDKNGKEVWLTGCNWFGYNTGTNIFDGVWNCNLEDSIASIADHGFNVLRVPISAELINQWASGTYPTANFNQALNPNLNGKNSLEIFDYVVENCEANGIKIIIDIHSAETNAMGHMTSLWYTDKISVEQYYASLEWMSARYKNNDTVIAYDIKNEPHGKPSEGLSGMAIWNNSTAKNNWKYTAETAAKKVLAKNPNVLILVEGTESYPKDIKKNNFTSTNMDDYNTTWWGGNLRGVKDYPINLGKYQNKLVYSPHDYGPAVYQQPWFQKNYTYQSLMKDCWRDNWFYIYENGTAPLLIGEWGGYMTEPNLTWMKYMRQLIKENKLNHTFWCFNANSGDTGGLVKDDFTTWDTEKYNFVKEVLWQQNGKFVGLDHKVPLGNNGITLSDAK